MPVVDRRRDQDNENRRCLFRASALGFLIAALLGAGFAVAPQASGQQAGKPPAPPSGDAAPLLPRTVLEKIPARASGADARPEDFVNFVIVGTEADMTLVFHAAGWTAVDRTKAGAAASPGPPVTLSEEEYVAMPLSEQFLFGKPQDYGFAQDALVSVVQARHDARIWKAPFALNGQALWVGAVSHEGPWWDNSAGAVSYAADPHVDDERDFLGNSLRTTGLVERSGYVTSVGEPGKTHPAASDGFRTDGRVFVIKLIHL